MVAVLCDFLDEHWLSTISACLQMQSHRSLFVFYDQGERALGLFFFLFPPPHLFHFSNVNFEVTLVVQKTKHLVLESNLET